jgi:hypothetical protein
MTNHMGARRCTVLLMVRATSGVVAGEALDDAGAVGVGLQAPEAPEAGVAEGAVVEVHGVLGGDDDADADGSGLFHERNEGALGGRVRGMGGKEAVDFVEDAERSETLAARE